MGLLVSKNWPKKMFNWFGGGAHKFPPLPVGYIDPAMPKVKSVMSAPENGYTVGVSKDGSTVLKLTCDNQTVTLTMTAIGTRQLIRMLETTITEEEEVKNA